MPRRTHLSVAQKAELRLYYRAHPHLTHEDLIRWAQTHFSVLVGRSTMGSILRAPAEASLNPQAKRNQMGRYPEMERQLYQFVLQSPDLGQLNDSVLCNMANEILRGERTVTKSWVFRFKQRHAFAALRELRRIIDDFDPRDVFNFNGMGLFYQMGPRQLQLKEIKTQNMVTVGLCCNMDGSEKLQPVVVHGDRNGLVRAQIPVKWYYNDHAWITDAIFEDWLQDFNAMMEGREVLLLVDTAPCHEGGDSIDMPNVKVHFLPPNTPANLQPMRAGIAQQFKTHVKTMGAQWMLDHRRSAASLGKTEGKLGVLTALKHIVQSWQYVAPPMIRNCWAHTGIISGEMVAILQQEHVPQLGLDTSILDGIIALLEPNKPMTGLEYVKAEEDVAVWMPMADELPPAPRSRRGTQQYEGVAEAETEARGADPNQVQSMSHAEALIAASQLSEYAFATGIDVPGLEHLINTARERCRRSSRS